MAAFRERLTVTVVATGGAFMDPLEPDAHTSKPSLSRGILLLWLLVPLVGLIVSLYLALT